MYRPKLEVVGLTMYLVRRVLSLFGICHLSEI